MALSFAPLFSNPHLQTILGSLGWATDPPSHQKLVTLPDGDRISLEITTPNMWKEHDPTVLLLHGLCGSHRSSYLVRMAKRLKGLGIRAIRMNMRGCGSGKKLAKQFYHGGRSEDVFEVLKALKMEHPKSPITLIGYSLGGNIALKLAGELLDHCKLILKKVIAVCPPVDLYQSVQMFNQKQNRLYDQRFSRALRDHALELHRDLSIPKNLKVIDFDRLVTAPCCGFESELDYYSKSSSAPYVPNIQIPCQILFAKDDPLICHACLDTARLPPNVEVFKTQKGGHLGFLANPFQKMGFRWLDSLLVEWILNGSA